MSVTLETGASDAGLNLTARESAVLALVADGLTTTEIAFRLGLSRHAAARCVAGLLTAARVRNRAALVARAYQLAVLPVPPEPGPEHEHAPVGLRLDEPVLVLTCARSGSTLLRFLLDAHPVLACPAETTVADVCARMGTLGLLLGGPPVSAGASRPTPESAAAIRSWVAAEYGPYLARVGKERWCDKSLGTAELAREFLSLYPRTKFICLYRHSMDVIYSLLDACPFGLSGYGLDRFVAVHPGNSVAAAADYWAWHTRSISEFEAANPDACIGVRYEDLVSDPQGQADRIFAFLGEACLPDAASVAFAGATEAWGPSDHKIFGTSRVHAESVGRGSQVPAGAIPTTVLAVMNSLLEPLGYEPVGEFWNTRPVPVLAGATARTPTGRPPEDVMSDLDSLLVPRIARRLAAANGVTADDGPVFLTASVPQGGAALATCSWRVDLADRTVTVAPERDPEHGWAVIGDARDWTAILAGVIAPLTALRRGNLRLVPSDDADTLPALRPPDRRATVLTWLLTPDDGPIALVDHE